MEKSKKELIDEFGYLIDKIKSAPFSEDPFRFVLIDDFLSEDHLSAIINAVEINRSEADTTEALIEDLQASGYAVQSFPGCTTSIDDYLSAQKNQDWDVDKGLLEGYGITFRLRQYQTSILKDIVAFLNLPEFKRVLEEKFNIEESNYVETAIQKYLDGYEISPHPDIRKKAATYMLNINTRPEAEQMELHTYLMKFKDDKEYIYDFWQKNKEVDRCWVPWDWCESKLKTSSNNSIVLFAPSDDTLHAVKLSYDHLKFQRTQIYGNLWYNTETTEYTPSYKYIASEDVDLNSIYKDTKRKKSDKSVLSSIKRAVPTKFKSRIKKAFGK